MTNTVMETGKHMAYLAGIRSVLTVAIMVKSIPAVPAAARQKGRQDSMLPFSEHNA